MSRLDEDIVRLYLAIEAIGLPLMVCGGVAAIYFGEPRATNDIDVVVDAREQDAERIISAFDHEKYYAPPIEVVQAEIRRGGRGHFNIIDFASGLKADVYPAGDDQLCRYGLEHAKPRAYSDIALRMAPATYVIAMKLKYHSMSKQDKHLRDIRTILAVSPQEVDMDLVERWAREFSALEVWNACKQRKGEE